MFRNILIELNINNLKLFLSMYNKKINDHAHLAVRLNINKCFTLYNTI